MRQSSVVWILVCFLASVIAFYGGLTIGWHTGNANVAGAERETNNLRVSPSPPVSESGTETKKLQLEISDLKDRLQKASDAADRQASKITKLEASEKGLRDQLLVSSEAANHNANHEITIPSPHHVDAFDKDHTGKFASGMEFVDRNDFADRFDIGVPLDETTNGNDKVLLLYSDRSAFPDTKHEEPLSVEEATTNCHNLHVVLTHANGRKNQCIAIMGQFESFHVHKYMRVEGNKGKIDPNLPLRYTNRGHQQNGRVSFKIPLIERTKDHWKNLVSYLQSLDTVLDGLKPHLEKAAAHNANNAVIVMVCNFGQSELLMNFICNTRAKGLESVLANVVLFATDQATHDLATSMGITSVYIDAVFAGMPENAAGQYLDNKFRDMMRAKVYCIHLVSMLGHDILFQDVDVIWYRNPLTWFHNETNPHFDFDMYFQDDGNHDLYYAPYAANTGFYYVRNNEKTRYFFNSFLMAGDQILASGSHQIPLITHLSEQASLNGLRVKTWERNQKEFPGGFTFHTPKHKDFMKDLIAGGEGASDTYIFHMSWTENKHNKVKYYEQMGQWYLKDTCVGRLPSDIQGKGGLDCCAADPIVTCHFRDKPSKIPCEDSPAIDKGHKSWWK